MTADTERKVVNLPVHLTQKRRNSARKRRIIMELLEMLKSRRTIRKFTREKIAPEKLEKIIEAGLYAPNPGGKQGAKILLLNDAAMIEKIGIVNAECENRNWNIGVSAEQPSIIDDLSIKSGFYGCQSLAMVCIGRDQTKSVNPIGGAFTCAENMVLEAYDLGISSCIVGRAEATFSTPEMAELLKTWGLDENYIPIVFVCLGYIDGAYPHAKERKDGRVIIVDA